MDSFLTRAVPAAALVLFLTVLGSGAAAQDAAIPTKPPSAPVPAEPSPLGGNPPAAPAPVGASVGGDAATATPPPADAAPADQPDKPRPIAPVGPPLPSRGTSAVLRVLDKVTAETMAFEAPVGRRVRYKSLVFEVKACVTRGVGDPEPRPSAYLIVTSDAGATSGGLLSQRQVFKGWMFANAPSLHALKHPVYDAWLVACSAAAPGQ